jgi:Tfp pilus assembly protein PilO
MSTIQRNQLGITFIVILVLLKFVVAPWLVWVSEKTDTIAQLSVSQQRFENVSERHAALLKKQQQIEHSYAQLQKQWAGGNAAQNSVAVLRYIEAAAKAQGVELSNRSARDAVISDTTTIPARMFVQGSPEALLKFVHQLETGSPAMIVHKMTLNKNSQIDNTLVMNLEVVVLAEPGQQDELGK